MQEKNMKAWLKPRRWTYFNIDNQKNPLQVYNNSKYAPKKYNNNKQMFVIAVLIYNKKKHEWIRNVRTYNQVQQTVIS